MHFSNPIHWNVSVRGQKGAVSQEFLGNRYYQNGKNRYFWRKVSRAVAVWEAANGAIPAGHQLHHKNGDGSNDALENLEILTTKAHTAHHRNVAASLPGRIYWKKRDKKRANVSISLHVAVWTHHNGPVPPGYQIHHKNGDPANCAIDNLELVLRSEHARHHTKQRIASGDLKPPSPAALAKAAAWHSSPAGTAWHAANGRNQWENATRNTFLCERCGAPYETYPQSRKRGFCSPYCQSRARIASGVDDETRTCPICAKSFRINRYSRTKTCSRRCGAVAMIRTRASKKAAQP